MSIKLIIIAYALIVAACGFPVNQTQLWFDNKIDHFTPDSELFKQTYKQRFWLIDEFYDSNSQNPIILYICGEYTCPGLPEQRLFPLELAIKFKAAIVVVEHRYYGDSMPFGADSLKLENMKYLTVEQALADLAFFITSAKNGGFEFLNPKSPWITIGGSYPGAMSAWFRSKYPFLTVGALASSAVINSILDFQQFDQQIYTSASKSGLECQTNIVAISNYVEQNLDENMKASFTPDAVHLTDPEFLFYFADILVEMIQYGKRIQLCELLKGTIDQILAKLRIYVKENNVSCQDYGSYFLSNTTVDINKGSRSWTYQTCTQVGWFQTASSTNRVRSNQLNIENYRKWCNDSFGTDIFPNTLHFNMLFGGQDLQASNIIFTNGGEDPWQWAGLRKQRAGIHNILLQCEQCAHCVDLYTPNGTDSAELLAVRQFTTIQMSIWFRDYYRKNNNQQLAQEFHSFM